MVSSRARRNVVLSPSSSGGVRRVTKRITGAVVEKTSEYVIVMTRKDQLVKIRPENIIRRGVMSHSDKQKEAQAALALVMMIEKGNPKTSGWHGRMFLRRDLLTRSQEAIEAVKS